MSFDFKSGDEKFTLNSWGMKTALELMGGWGCIAASTPVYFSEAPVFSPPEIRDAFWDVLDGDDSFGRPLSEIIEDEDSVKMLDRLYPGLEITPLDCDIFDAYREELTAARRAHSSKYPGIPYHKFCTNDRWIITQDELLQAVSRFPEKFYLKEDPIGRFLRFLMRAEGTVVVS